MSAMTAGTSQPTASVPPWNPNKPAAPTPPAGQEGQSSANTQSRQGASSGGNYPDVTAGVRDLYEVDQRNQNSRSNDNVSDLSVVPDYPLDSLPRNVSHQSVSTSQEARTQPSDSRPAQVRSVQSTSGSRTNPRTSGSTEPGTGVVASPASMPPSQTTQQRVSGDMVPHGARAPRQSSQQAGVSHSNVSVSVNHGMPPPSSGRIRTQDLNVGVAARLEQHASGTNTLPDLVAHSQPQSSSRAPATVPRNQVPVQSDPRFSQSHRYHESHSRHRHHRDHRHARSHRHRRRSHSGDDDVQCKESCLKCVAVGFSFRWILVVLSLLGVCCVVTGIILAALHAAGNSFLFLAIMFIGLGVLLVVVVGVGWKCTPRGHEPLHALLNIGDFRQNNRSSRRQRNRHRRDGRWHGGVMYPEFQFPRPPPTYDASMREYQQQQLALAQQQQTPDIYDPDDTPIEDYSLPSSPPPSYRSRASTVRAGIQITFPPNQGGDFPDSRPPTYRSHPSNTLPGHGRTRPSLSRDDDGDDDIDTAPADVAFTGSSVVVDTNTNQNTTSIQIGAPGGAQNQNVTVSVTTVSVTTASNLQSAPVASVNGVQAVTPGVGLYTVTASPVEGSEVIDSVGDMEGDRVDTAL